MPKNIQDNAPRSIQASRNYRVEIGFRHVFAGMLLIALYRMAGLWFGVHELYFDEAQYWVWAQDLQFGYYSKPPLIAWTIAASTAVCGDAPACVRSPSILLHLLAALALMIAGNTMFSKQAGMWAGLTYFLLPVVSFSSALIATDVILAPFWITAMSLSYWLIIKPNWRLIILCGLAIGLGLNAKYAMAYLLPCTLIYVVFAYFNRRSVNVWPIALAWLIGLLLLLPNIAWNISHNFATLAHTGDNANWSDTRFSLRNLASFWIAQPGLLGPVVFAAAVMAVFRKPIWADRCDAVRYLICMSVPILLLVSAQAFIARANANWAATALGALTLLGTVWLGRYWPAWRLAGIAINGVVALLIPLALPFADRLSITGKRLLFEPMIGWQQASQNIRQLAEPNLPLVFERRRFTAGFAYQLAPFGYAIYALPPREGFPRDHFQLTRPLVPNLYEAFVLVSENVHKDQVTSQSETVELLGKIAVKRGVSKSLALYVFEVKGYAPR